MRASPWIMITPYLLYLMASGIALAGDSVTPGDHLAYCRFGPRIRVLADPGHQHCAEELYVQAVEWECVPPDDVDDRTADFKKDVLKEAAAVCARHCESSGRGCLSKFRPSPETALETDFQEAVAAGKKFGCQSSCSGRAFAYYGLYDLGYVSGDLERVKKYPANCICYQSR